MEQDTDKLTTKSKVEPLIIAADTGYNLAIDHAIRVIRTIFLNQIAVGVMAIEQELLKLKKPETLTQ